MDTASFILETIAHFAKRTDGPPPSVPLHHEPRFETHLASLCVDQRLSPLVSNSLEQLALPPTISRVTASRIKRHASELENDTLRRLRLLGHALDELRRDDVRALIIGDALCAALYYPKNQVKAVGRLDLVIHEEDAARAIAALERAGFVLPGTHPVIGRGGFDVEELVRFHHYIAPLVLVSAAGERLRLRFRVVDVGHPGHAEPAWSRAQPVTIGETEAEAVCSEDQLVNAMIEFGVSGCWRLGALADGGLLVHESGALDWDYITERTRAAGAYLAFYFAFERMCRLLSLPRVLDNLMRPSFVGLKTLAWWWRPETIDYVNEPRATAGRFKFGLIACGGTVAKARWAWRHVAVEPHWIERFLGKRPTPWRWIKFIVLTKEHPFSSPPYTKRLSGTHEHAENDRQL